MATYSWAELKDLTSVKAVSSWSEAKCLLFQSHAENILTSLDLDTTMEGYSSMYSSAVMLLFDWIAENPSSVKTYSRGKVSVNFLESIPAPLQTLLKAYKQGNAGTFSPAVMARQDIGLK